GSPVLTLETRRVGDRRSKLRQPAMLGRAIDENILMRESFRQRGAQFKFAHYFDGPMLLAPPAEQRCDRLGFAGEPVAASDFRLRAFNTSLKTGGVKRRVEF